MTGCSWAGLSARYLLACDGLALDRGAAGRSRVSGTDRGQAVRHPTALRAAAVGDTVEVHYGRRAEFYVTHRSPPNEVGIAMLGSRHTDFDAALGGDPGTGGPAGRCAGVQLPSRSRAVPTAHSCPHRRARAAGRRRLRLRGCDHGRGAPPRVCRGSGGVGCIAVDDPRRYQAEWTRITRGFRMTTTALVRVAASPLRRGIVPLSAALPGRFGAVVESHRTLTENPSSPLSRRGEQPGPARRASPRAPRSASRAARRSGRVRPRPWSGGHVPPP